MTLFEANRSFDEELYRRAAVSGPFIARHGRRHPFRGQACGVHQAELNMGNAWLLVSGAAVIAVAVAVATSGGDSPAVATTSAVGTAS
jgi:hypothetical protein